MAGILEDLSTGEVVTWQNDTGGALPYGSIITIGPLVGVLISPEHGVLPDGSLGDVHLEGVARFPKQAGAISRGAEVDYDASEDNVTTGLAGAAGDVTSFGIAVEDALDSDAEVDVLLTPGRGVLV